MWSSKAVARLFSLYCAVIEDGGGFDQSICAVIEGCVETGQSIFCGH